MDNKECTFTYQEEEQGNRVKKDGRGITRSGILQKQAKDGGSYFVIFVEDLDTGHLREVFASSVVFKK